MQITEKITSLYIKPERTPLNMVLSQLIEAKNAHSSKYSQLFSRMFLVKMNGSEVLEVEISGSREANPKEIEMKSSRLAAAKYFKTIKEK